MTEPLGDESVTEPEPPGDAKSGGPSGPPAAAGEATQGDDAISDELLALFRCPTDHTPLTRADAALVEQVNQAIHDGTLRNQLGETVKEPMQGALVSADGHRLYPIHNGILTMIADEAIPWEGEAGAGPAEPAAP